MSKRGQFSRRLFVFGYPGAVTHGELTTQFEEYTFIEFNSSIDATTARTKMHNAYVRNQRIQVHFDNKIPNQYKPNNFDDRDFMEPAISPPPPPPPPHNLRRSSNESSIHSSQSHIASPQSSPNERLEHRRDRGGSGSSFRQQQPYYHDRRSDGPYDSRQPPYSRNNGGYAGQDRRWNGNERVSGGPMRHRPGNRYPAGGPHHRPYNRGPPPHNSSSRYDNHGPRSSYGRPPSGGRHYRDSTDDRQDDDTPSYDSAYSTRINARSRSPARRPYYRDGGEREDQQTPYDEPEGWQEEYKEYNSSYTTPQRSRSSSQVRENRKTDSQISLDLDNDGGSWQSVNPKDTAYNGADDRDNDE
ncbi:hypothetical protein FB639_002413, partial [Coemansia asiatica]